MREITPKVMRLHFVYNSGTSRSEVNQNLPKPPTQSQIPLRDLAFMKQDLEAKLSTLEKQGHLVQPQLRAHLEKSIQDLLIKIEDEMRKTTVVGCGGREEPLGPPPGFCKKE